MKAIIIGGGIVGLSCAYYLHKSGAQVVVLDKTDLSDGCSYGNLGMIVPSHFVPLAAPGMVAQGIRWMFDQTSPFYVKPSLNSSLLSWGWKFIRSATAQHVEKSATPLLQLNLLSRTLYEELALVPGFDFGLERRGIMMYYNTAKAGEEEVHLCHKAREMGLDVEALTREQVHGLEPGIRPDVLGAVHYRSDAHLHPNQLVVQLMAYLRNAGVQFCTHSPVTRMITHANSIRKVITPGGEYEGDIVVLAAGSWMPELARLANERLSLMPGKGYSFDVHHPPNKLHIPAILCEARVALSPMNGFIRYGGTMEIAPVNDTINMKRVQGIVQAVQKYLPALQLQMPDKSKVWYGFRPCTPDGLPYLGFAARTRNLLIAGGHAMSGLSLAPATGYIISALANNRHTDIDINPFSPARFL